MRVTFSSTLLDRYIPTIAPPSRNRVSEVAKEYFKKYLKFAHVSSRAFISYAAGGLTSKYIFTNILKVSINSGFIVPSLYILTITILTISTLVFLMNAPIYIPFVTYDEYHADSYSWRIFPCWLIKLNLLLGMDVSNCKNKLGEDPVMIAARYNHAHYIKELVKAPNIDLNRLAGTHFRLSFYIEALSGESLANAQNITFTPLMKAVMSLGLESAQELLCSPKVDVNAKNSRGQTALDLLLDTLQLRGIIAQREHEIICLLVEKGADCENLNTRVNYNTSTGPFPERIQNAIQEGKDRRRERMERLDLILERILPKVFTPQIKSLLEQMECNSLKWNVTT